MIHRGKRFDAVRQQFIQQSIVEVEALRIGRAGTVRENARPRHRKTIGLCSKLPDELNVLLVAVIMIVGGVGIASIQNLAACVNVTIPDRRTARVFADRALDLIGGGGRAPQKITRKAREALAGGAAFAATIDLTRLGRYRRNSERRPAGNAGKMAPR